MIIHEQFVNLYLKDKTIFNKVFGDITKVGQLIKRIDDISVDYAKFNYSEEEGSNKFKGDLFEIFAEGFFKLIQSNRIGIYNYTPTIKNAVGVDATARGIDNKPATVQVKYLKNPTDKVMIDKVGYFPTVSNTQYGVDMRTTTNMVVFTSGESIHHDVNRLLGVNIRSIGIDLIDSHTVNNDKFWHDLMSLIVETIEKRFYGDIPLINLNEYVKQEVDKLNTDQKLVFDRMLIVNRLTIASATGIGKGRNMFVDILNKMVNTIDHNIFGILTHRIDLSKQHMKDIFIDWCVPLIGQVGFIFIASNDFDTNELQLPEINNKLKELNLNFIDIINTITTPADIRCATEIHRRNNRKVIIISTYHSSWKMEHIDIDDLYCDEAHMLAGETRAERQYEFSFKNNFYKITPRVKNHYFLTATPKDWCVDDIPEGDDTFLMNNKAIFGERIGTGFAEGVDKGYIVPVYIDVISPTNYTPDNNLSESIDARAEIVIDGFLKGEKWFMDRTAYPDKIGFKSLVKCKNVTKDMWPIYDKLLELTPAIKELTCLRIFAGSSKGAEDEDGVDPNKCYIDGVPCGRREYIKELSELKSTERVIVLHYDILSEGINVPGFICNMLLSGNYLTDRKTLQNIGRITRLHSEGENSDRKRLERGEIFVGGEGWIKPFGLVQIPYWDRESLDTKNKLVNLIGRLCDIGMRFELDGVSLGDDKAVGDDLDPDEDPLNRRDRVNRTNTIEDLYHQIQETREQKRVDSLSPLEFIYDQGCFVN